MKKCFITSRPCLALFCDIGSDWRDTALHSILNMKFCRKCCSSPKPVSFQIPVMKKQKIIKIKATMMLIRMMMMPSLR